MPFRRSLGYKPSTVVPLVTLVNRFMGRNIGLHGEVPVSRAFVRMDRQILDGSYRQRSRELRWISCAHASIRGRPLSTPARGHPPCLLENTLHILLNWDLPGYLTLRITATLLISIHNLEASRTL